MFRSGRLTRARLSQILKWVNRTPHNLRAVAKACNIYPADLMAWYVAGQDPNCRDPIMAELAWRVAEIRGEAVAKNYERIVAAADGGKKTKVINRPNGKEVTEEDVLPAAWAIEKLEQMAAESPWEITPNAEQAEDLYQMMKGLEPTPLLTEGDLEEPLEDNTTSEDLPQESSYMLPSDCSHNPDTSQPLQQDNQNSCAASQQVAQEDPSEAQKSSYPDDSY